MARTSVKSKGDYSQVNAANVDNKNARDSNNRFKININNNIGKMTIFIAVPLLVVTGLVIGLVFSLRSQDTKSNQSNHEAGTHPKFG